MAVSNHPMAGLKGTQQARDLMNQVRGHKGGGMAAQAPTKLPAPSGAKAPAKRTGAERMKDASEGVALPDGSYPIRNQTQLDDAVKDWIRTGRSLSVKSHIDKRAKALGLELPENMEPKGAPDEIETARQIAGRGK